MALVPRWFRSFLLWQCVGLCLLSVCLLFVLHPPGALYHSPLSWSRPYANLPRWGVQQIYGEAHTRDVVFGKHKDRIVDWAEPSWFHAWGEAIATWSATQRITAHSAAQSRDAAEQSLCTLIGISRNKAQRTTQRARASASADPPAQFSDAAARRAVSGAPFEHTADPDAVTGLCVRVCLMCRIAVTLPAKIVPPPLHLVHLLQGPAQLQVLRTLVLLGVPDVLADKVLNLNDLHAALLANEAKQAPLLRAGLMLDASDAALPRFSELPLGKLERLMSFALSIGYFDEVSYRGSHIYVHNAQSVVLRKDHPNSPSF